MRMNLRRLILCCLISLLPILAAETISFLWMNPTVDQAYIYPTLQEPFANPDFKSSQDVFDKIKVMLGCTQGWQGSIGSKTSVNTELAWIEWSHTSTNNVFEAFHHKPEVCMSMKGMILEHSYPHRVYGEGDKRFIFDSMLFRPSRGGLPIYVFKTVWISGIKGMSLRKNLFDGTSNEDFKRMRLATVINRFKPLHARVLMAGVGGLPSEELAWKSFSREILPQVQWTTVQPSSGN